MWFTGLLIVIWDFIVLPFRFVKGTFEWLGQIGTERTVSAVGDPELPFLNWMVVAGRVVVTLFAIILLAVVVIGGMVVMARDAGAGLAVLFLGPIFIWALVWFFGIWLESISLFARIARHLHNMANELNGLRTDLRRE